MQQDKKREELIRLVCDCYEISKPQFMVWDYLIQANKEVSIRELYTEFKKDRTTVQKIIIALCKKNMILKQQVNLDRGFMFVYKCIDHESVKYILFKRNEEQYLTRNEIIRGWGCE